MNKNTLLIVICLTIVVFSVLLTDAEKVKKSRKNRQRKRERAKTEDNHDDDYEERPPPNSTKAFVRSLLRNYDRADPPTLDASTRVELGIYINTFYSISEQTMDYAINIYLRQNWTDPRLAFTPRSNNSNGAEKIKLEDGSWEKLWVPDVFFRNEKKAMYHHVTIPNRLMFLYSTGQIWYVTKISATLSCNMDLRKYPFDTQYCPIMLESFGHTMDTLYFAWMENAVDVDPELTLPQFNLAQWTLMDCSQNYTAVGHTMDTLYFAWMESAVQNDPDIKLSQFDLVATDLADCSQNYTAGAFPCLKATFKLKRDIGYYMIQVYIPSILIVILSWVAFWINIDASPARVSLGLLTVLTMTTQSASARASLPRVSYVKAIDVWMSACLLFVFASLLEFAVVNVYSRREIPKPKVQSPSIVKKFKDKEKQAMDPLNEIENGGSKSKPPPQQYIRDPYGREKARMVDKACRKVFPGVFFLFSIIYWVVYTFVEI